MVLVDVTITIIKIPRACSSYLVRVYQMINNNKEIRMKKTKYEEAATAAAAAAAAAVVAEKCPRLRRNLVHVMLCYVVEGRVDITRRRIKEIKHVRNKKMFSPRKEKACRASDARTAACKIPTIRRAYSQLTIRVSQGFFEPSEVFNWWRDAVAHAYLPALSE